VKFTLTSAKLTGNPGSSGWTQIHEFRPEDEEKLKKRGYFFAVVSTSYQESGAGGAAYGRELLTRLHEEYFGNLETSAFVALKNAVEKVAREGEKKVEIAAAAILDDVVYTTAQGGAGVSLYRSGGLAKILVSREEEVTSASGFPQEKDLLILGTRAFFAAFPEGVLKASLEGPQEAVVESLAPLVHAKENEGSLGMALIKFSPTAPPPLLPEKKKLFERKIYVKEDKKTTFSVGAILLVLLLVSIVFGIRQKEIKKIKSRYQPALSQALQDFNEAQGLINVDSSRSRELFLASQTKIEELLAQKISDKELLALSQKIKENESLFLGIYREEPELFLDLALLSSGFKGQALVSSAEKLYVFDQEGKKIAAIELGSKKTQMAAGPDQLQDIAQISAYEGSLYGLSGDGIYLLGKEKKKVIEKDWGEEVFFSLYAANIYLIDKGGSVVTRFPGIDGQFAKGQNWLAPGIKLDLSQVKAVAIDGNIWLLFDPLKILKLSQGSTQRFGPEGIPGGLTSAEALYSNEELQNLYLLDKNQKRILVLDKSGKYQAEYLADKIGEATNLVVSEKEKKIILLCSDKLYAIQLAN
jgi:hypothetical protein